MIDSARLRFVIVGGVAAGASAAARARRLSEHAQITVLERGPDVSFANCGLPYHIGGEICERAALAVQTPASLQALLALDVRTSTEATAIDRAAKRVQVRSLASGTSEWLAYDKLLLAPGAAPLRPALQGIDDRRIFTLRSLQDMDRIEAAAGQAKRVVVIGAGFIGLEVAEQFVRRGLHVTLVELQHQVLPQLDAPLTLLLEDELRRHGVELVLGDGLVSFAGGEQVSATLRSGRTLEADLVVLAIGVRPESSLARAAGLALGERGHIVVDEFLRTSDADIYAAGDVVETHDLVDRSATSTPLGGPANRQGRAVADHIFQPQRARAYRGGLGTAIVRAFDVSAGVTGWTAKRLRAAGRPFRTITVNEQHHAGYFPGAQPIQLALTWDPRTQRVLGAQCSGLAGVDKRLDVLATAIAGELTIDDLAQLELAYAPPFGAAKDIVNIAGFASCNARDGLVDPLDELPDDAETQIVDVRPAAMAKAHPVPRVGVLNIPYRELRARCAELDRARPVVTVCTMGKTSYFAARVLAQRGFRVQSLCGGLRARLDPRSPGKLPTA